MAHTLTDAEWDELVELIEESPSTRIGEALSRLPPTTKRRARGVIEKHRRNSRLSPEDWLLHIASISSGPAFDRALLRELRHLSVH